jgi:predicted nucleic acid-binding protein
MKVLVDTNIILDVFCQRVALAWEFATNRKAVCFTQTPD